MPWRASIPSLQTGRDQGAEMTISVVHADVAASPMRGRLPLWVGIGVYALFLLAGNRLLIDPDTMWQVTLGQWILDHRAVPETDVYSFTMRGEIWISTQWLAQAIYAEAYAISGWSGPVVVAASAIAATFGLLARFLSRRLSESTTLVFIAAALALIMEWKPTDFGSVGPFEICLLLGIGLALYRGVTLPLMRIVLLLGLLHMALAQGRAAEILALLGPLVLAAPLARQIGVAASSPSTAAVPARRALLAGVTVALVAGTFAYA